MTIYMQMGGNPGDGATLPRTNGARAAAQAFGVPDLVEQYSGWLPEQMLNHFREALAADPDCIVIMGHPGSGAFADLVAEAEGRGIVVTSGNAPLTELFEKYQAGGFGYAGVELYAGGWLTGKKHGRGRQAEGGRQGAGVRPARRGRARPERPRPEGGARGRRPQGRLHRDQPRGEPGRLARRADPHQLSRVQPGREGDRHPARQRHLVHPQGARGRRQAAGRGDRRRHRPRARDDRWPAGRLDHRGARPAALSCRAFCR